VLNFFGIKFFGLKFFGFKFFVIKFLGLTFLKFYSLIKHTHIELSLEELRYLDLPVLQEKQQPIKHWPFEVDVNDTQ
jgi:hypothetical protein